MEMEQVPAALQERLGIEATSGLLKLLDSTYWEWRAGVIAGCTDRFEGNGGRLVELLKWCFLFWIGQVIALAGIMGMMFRLFRP